MQLTVMPSRAVSSATDFVKPATPCLAATYADLLGEAMRLCAEAVLMMRPQPFDFIADTANRVVWNTAERLMAMIASHFSGGKLSTGETCWMPALLMRMSGAPSSSVQR